MGVQYTLSRCKGRQDDTLVGPVHGSKDGYTSLCGQDFGMRAWEHTNNFTGVITCKRCLKVVNKQK